MLKMVALSVLSLGLVSVPTFAQNPDPAPDISKAQRAMSGTVKNFDPGKSIDVDVNGVSHKYDLSKTDTLYTINPEVKTGSDVTIVETIDNSGKKAVTIEIASARKG